MPRWNWNPCWRQVMMMCVSDLWCSVREGMQCLQRGGCGCVIDIQVKANLHLVGVVYLDIPAADLDGPWNAPTGLLVQSAHVLCLP